MFDALKNNESLNSYQNLRYQPNTYFFEATYSKRKLIIYAKLKGQLNLTLPLLINQTQRAQNQAEVLLMRINKWIHGGPIFKVDNEIICNNEQLWKMIENTFSTHPLLTNHTTP